MSLLRVLVAFLLGVVLGLASIICRALKLTSPWQQINNLLQ
jgi:hypothetical protein